MFYSHRFLNDQTESRKAYVQKKHDSYTSMFIILSAYMISLAFLNMNRFHSWGQLLIMIGLISFSAFLYERSNLISSEMFLFVAAVVQTLTFLQQLTTFHFYGSLVLLLFSSVILYVQLWQISLVYIAITGLLTYRAYLLNISRFDPRLTSKLLEDHVFISFSIFSLILLAIFLDLRIRREIHEKLRLERSAFVDLLTGVYTRQKLKTDVQAPFLSDRNYQLAVIDIDHFKEVNDTFGHDTGDVLLQSIAQTIKEEFPEPDFRVYRWGGEEFVLIGKHLTDDDFDQRLNKFRTQISQGITDSKIQVTISIGTTLVAHHPSYDQAFNVCDQAMYQAKNQGRDQLVRGGA